MVPTLTTEVKTQHSIAIRLQHASPVTVAGQQNDCAAKTPVHDVGEAIVAAATPRTTILSAAFVRSAAQGECYAAWQNLQVPLATGRLSNLDSSAARRP